MRRCSDWWTWLLGHDCIYEGWWDDLHPRGTDGMRVHWCRCGKHWVTG